MEAFPKNKYIYLECRKILSVSFFFLSCSLTAAELLFGMIKKKKKKLSKYDEEQPEFLEDVSIR